MRRTKSALPVVGCTLPEALERLTDGERVYIDDGEIGARALEHVANGVVLEIVQAPSRGHKIRSDKGLNFPDTASRWASLTEKDPKRPDLPCAACRHDWLFVRSKPRQTSMRYWRSSPNRRRAIESLPLSY